MWLEKLILNKAEKKLLPYRLQADFVKNKFGQEYSSHLPLLKKYYGKVTYWHGTGRYHYQHAKNSRYDEKSSSVISDILQSVVKDKGLRPHFDPWITVEGSYIKTVSVTHCRMHARLYADTHRYEKDSIRYEFGSTKCWLFLLIKLVSFSILRHPTKSARDFVKILFSKSSIEKGQTWVQAVRKEFVIKPWRFWEAFEAKSDILENYPILLGIKDEIKTLCVSPFMDKFEARTDHEIKFENFTHIEVPFDKIGEVEAFLLSEKISLPVIPIEFGEIYCSQFSLKDLIYNPALSIGNLDSKKFGI